MRIAMIRYTPDHTPHVLNTHTLPALRWYGPGAAFPGLWMGLTEPVFRMMVITETYTGLYNLQNISEILHLAATHL